LGWWKDRDFLTRFLDPPMTAILSKDRRAGFGGKVHGFRADIGMGVLARRFRIFRQTRF
jgi:hypothetical protein